MCRSCPEELGREQWRRGSRGTAGSLGVPRGGLRPGAGSSWGGGLQSQWERAWGKQVRQALTGGWALALGVTGAREGFPAGRERTCADLVLGSSIQPGQEAWTPACGRCFHQRARPAFPRRTERDGDRRGRDPEDVQKAAGKKRRPLVLVFCPQHQEGPVRRQESRPLPRRAPGSVPDGEQDRKRRNSNTLNPSLCWDQLPGV